MKFKKSIWISILVCFCNSLNSQNCGYDYSIRHNYDIEKHRRALFGVSLNNIQLVGNAFLVDFERGLFVSATHVLGNSNSAILGNFLISGIRCKKVASMAINKEDICLLQVEDLELWKRQISSYNASIEPLELLIKLIYGSDKFNPINPLAYIESPKTNKFKKIIKGRPHANDINLQMTEIEEVSKDLIFYRSNQTAVNGTSGSPIVDKKTGMVIGVTVESSHRTNQRYYTPSYYINELVKTLEPDKTTSNLFNSFLKGGMNVSDFSEKFQNNLENQAPSNFQIINWLRTMDTKVTFGFCPMLKMFDQRDISWYDFVRPNDIVISIGSLVSKSNLKELQSVYNQIDESIIFNIDNENIETVEKLDSLKAEIVTKEFSQYDLSVHVETFNPNRLNNIQNERKIKKEEFTAFDYELGLEEVNQVFLETQVAQLEKSEVIGKIMYVNSYNKLGAFLSLENHQNEKLLSVFVGNNKDILIKETKLLRLDSNIPKEIKTYINEKLDKVDVMFNP